MRSWIVPLLGLAIVGCGAQVKPQAPASFVANHGQFEASVRYEARGNGYELAAQDGGIEVALGDGTRARLRFGDARPVAGAKLPGTASYFLGGTWRRNLPTYREIVYPRAWPGIDVAVYGSAGRFEYDLRVAPGADPRAIALDFGDARLEDDGSLRVGSLRQLPPAAYQGDRRVGSAYVRNADGTIGVRVARYDRDEPLVIDPVLAYSTYLGGSGTDEAMAIAVDAAGSAYVTGQTQSTNFPAAGSPRGGGDVFVTKLAPDGRTPVWSAYLGGTGIDEGRGIALAPGGKVLVVGMTTSSDFALAGSLSGPSDAFVAELSASGDALVYGRYLGGDAANALAADTAGNAYVAGTTGDDAFAAKVSASGVAYSTPLGTPAGNDGANGVAVDANGHAWVAGYTGSDDFPAAPPTKPGGMDGFVTELGPTGAPVATRYLGGTGYDVATAIALTPGGAPVVVGATQSADFPASGHLSGASDAFASTPAGARFLGGEGADGVAVDANGHVFVAGRALNPSLDVFVTQLDGETALLGGGGSDQPAGVAVDAAGNAYVTGRAEAGFPTVNALQPNSGGGIDAFVAKLATGGSPTATPAPTVPPLPVVSVPPPPPPQPETTITARPPSSTTDHVVRFRFIGKVPGQIDPTGGVTFACRMDAGAFSPCTSPYTSPKLALGPHDFEVRAGAGTPAAFAFRVVKPAPQVTHRTCELAPHGAYHDRGTRDWGPCAFADIVCPRAAACLLDLGVDEHDDSYLFNYDVHLQRDDSGFKDRVYCFAPPLTTPVNPKLEVRFDPRRGQYNRHHDCQAQGALGLVDTSQDTVLRYRCLGAGHAPKPGGDRTTGEGFEDNAHLACSITVTIDRQVSELGDVLSDSPKAGASLLVYLPGPGSLTVAGKAVRTAGVKATAAGSARVPLKLTAKAVKQRRKKAIDVSVTATFQPSAGPVVTRGMTVRLARRRR